MFSVPLAVSLLLFTWLVPGDAVCRQQFPVWAERHQQATNAMLSLALMAMSSQPVLNCMICPVREGMATGLMTLRKEMFSHRFLFDSVKFCLIVFNFWSPQFCYLYNKNDNYYVTTVIIKPFSLK